jgi:hypothetical protein
MEINTKRDTRVEIRLESGDLIATESGYNPTFVIQMTLQNALKLERTLSNTLSNNLEAIGALDRPKTEADRNTIQHLRERVASLLVQNGTLQQELSISTDRAVILEQQLAKQQEKNLALQKELTIGAVLSNIRDAERFRELKTFFQRNVD